MKALRLSDAIWESDAGVMFHTTYCGLMWAPSDVKYVRGDDFIAVDAAVRFQEDKGGEVIILTDGNSSTVAVASINDAIEMVQTF